jgi:FdhD protein
MAETRRGAAEGAAEAAGKAAERAPRRSGTTATDVWCVDGDVVRRSDEVATEEPLEIRLSHRPAALIQVQLERRPSARTTLSITMRTPGDDFALAAGFLHGEGVVKDRRDIHAIGYCEDAGLDAERRQNTVTVELRPGLGVDLESLERRFYTTSACGVCGKASLEALRLRGHEPVPPGPTLPADVLRALPEKLRSAQAIFGATGGLHAAALFDVQGTLIASREDVGRHNAVDKLVGWALMEGLLPLHRHVVMVSGRTSFEIVQKCVAAGVPVVCAVSAPSSLAVDLAREFGITLVGFLRGTRFNVYAGMERIVR